MDDHRFDTLVRALSAGISRRRTLTVLAAALAGGSLRAALPDDAAALSRRQRRRCTRQGGTVCSAGTRSSECCSPSGVCVHGACACDPFNNTCPNDATGKCACTQDVNGTTGCCDTNSCCNNDRPCTVNGDCPKGSFCAPGCETGGHYVCTFPCIPGGDAA